MKPFVDTLIAIFSGAEWWQYALRIALFFLFAYILHRLARRLAPIIIRLGRFAPRKSRLSPERLDTLQSLVASAISLLALAAAILLSLRQFVNADTLVWVVGLFSAALGMGARPLLSDFLAGIGFLFEDTFAVGEKVEILGIEGAIEAVNLRTTHMRAPSGELYVVPNGEVRIVRNFSRGRFSIVNIKLKINAPDLTSALGLLDELGKEAVALLPNLLEPWLVLSETGSIGEHTELKLTARARFGKAAEMRPRLLALVQERLTSAGVELFD